MPGDCRTALYPPDVLQLISCPHLTPAVQRRADHTKLGADRTTVSRESNRWPLRPEAKSWSCHPGARTQEACSYRPPTSADVSRCALRLLLSWLLTP